MSSPPSRSAEAELIGGRCGKYTTFFKYGKKYLIYLSHLKLAFWKSGEIVMKKRTIFARFGNFS